MCRENIVTYNKCKHEASKKMLCLAAERELAQAQKRTTWCCISVSPLKTRVVCQVEYKLRLHPDFCDHCQAVRRREQARQVQQKATAERITRERQRREKINEAEARANARHAADTYQWVGRRAARPEHGDSFIENPLYKQVWDLLTEPEFRENIPPPTARSAARQATGSGKESSGFGSKPPYPVQPPVAEPSAQESSRRKPRAMTAAPATALAPVANGAAVRAPASGAPTVGLPFPHVGMAAHRRQMAGALPRLHIDTNSGAPPRSQVARNGGHKMPLPPQRQQSHRPGHAPTSDYEEPMPDDDFLDFVERYV
jgi:hypothetical protein